MCSEAFVQHELAGGSQQQQRNAAYLQQALASGGHPKLTELLPAGSVPSGPGPEPAGAVDRYAGILAGLLGPG